MATPFASRDAKLSASIDRAFGETFTILPFTSASDVNLPKLPDVSRTAYITTGAWDAPASAQQPNARGMKDDWAHKWNVSMPSASIADENMVWAPRPGDRILRAFDSSVYEISAVLPDSMGRSTLLLTARKR